MFTKNVKRGRGRPAGPTPQGEAARARLYEVAIGLIAAKGYESTTLRNIAAKAGVSVGLLYRYFPSKQAVVLALYDNLSADFARQAPMMPAGKWRDRFMFALRASIDTLTPHRVALRALTPILVGDPDEGIFSSATAFSRQRVMAIFASAVSGARDAPKAPFADALGRLLYLLHLGVLLWWLLDKSNHQIATSKLVALTEHMLPSASLSLRLPLMRKFVLTLDELMQLGLMPPPAAG